MAMSANWKNVNNWHWTEKNCLKWAQDYLKDNLTGTSVEKGELKAAISEVTSVEGDCDLNQRKGKVLTLFDLKIQLKWRGYLENGDEVTGRITVPEICHDSEIDDYVYEITVDNHTRDKDPLKELIRNELTKKLSEKFFNFSGSLIDAHSKDVYISAEDLKIKDLNITPTQSSPATPTPEQTSSTPKASGSAGQPTKKVVNTTTVNETIEFVASAHDLYNVLVDQKLINAWSRANATFPTEVGKEFSLFDGNITGKVLELVADKKIVQSWRLKTWPAGHYSTVTFALEQQSGSCNLVLEQTGVPLGEQDVVRTNWEQFYWNRIKTTFGYAQKNQLIIL
ncbi:hypothetical protein CONCODRAFT_75268 [Conidiobolus coronatus NRRL 28638]|uniref:Activator of Hsp90 ATPase AHSA1-like N-terminal domain-containing protein n=1 Tax=Conidiobolus coronatus (strain ATCC 28846 / CBS 209.66 / NRRL 28638) TaxID=796925 RepID=A0A137PBI5_CONC2|nr:hypothetical protein CONCODRAFT_75268 [Conidiobolus coronatus NRRL 28638]|eukprot:KXN72368.1 hypothetical protein CONCODRAFT_75268 [Conidiobolus coronatus NRRL 28638]